MEIARKTGKINEDLVANKRGTIRISHIFAIIDKFNRLVFY